MTKGHHRLPSLDMARGLIMLLMLVDHAREAFYLHRNVTDPMDVMNTETGLFVTRLLTHLCAPLFVLLSGISAWLYAQRQVNPQVALRRYLLTRGAFLVVLEVTIINFSWTLARPSVIYLQVIWAIGISMMALALLSRLPRPGQVMLALGIIAGHNLLDHWSIEPTHALFPLWAILHQRALLPLSEVLSVRTSYPVLPWIGVMLLGYWLAPSLAMDRSWRRDWLRKVGLGALLGFALLRLANVYGDLHPRLTDGSWPVLVKSFFNVTKYPPSLQFLLLTLGVGLLLMRWLEQVQAEPSAQSGWQRVLLTFGAVPLFFYVLHLYLLHGASDLLRAWLGANQGSHFGVPEFWMVWITAMIAAALLFAPCRRYAHYKREHPDSLLRFF